MNIVIICNPKRPDFFNYIVENLQVDHRLYILWEYKKENNISYEWAKDIEFLYWKDYVTPKTFIEKINPDRILFFEIIDLWQIPLIVACHRYNVTSFFIEHGVGNSVEQVVFRFTEIPSFKERWKYYSNKIISQSKRIIRNRIFYYSVLKYLNRKELTKYLMIPINFKMFTPLHTLSKVKFRKRSPHFAILFNKNNIDPYLLYNDIAHNDIFLKGVPFFDKYFVELPKIENHIIFIEHPYLEEGVLNWNDKFHEKVARTLEKFAIEKRVKIIIRLHPRSNIENWKKYNLNEALVIKQNEEMVDEMLSARLVLGYSSTLINVLIGCRKNIVLLGWHPQALIFGDDYSKTGLCHVSYDLNDISKKFSYWESNNLSVTNEDAYIEFLKEYNYPFDGKATERVIQTILHHEVS